MVQDFEQNQLNFEFKQKQLIMMGGDVKNVKGKLSLQDIKQMQKKYISMYYALTSINWGQGMTLGMAWQKALTQMDGFVATKTKIPNHPMAKELIKIHSEFRRDMAKSIMTSEYGEEKLNNNFKKSFIEYGEKTFAESKKFLDDMYNKHMLEKNLSRVPIAKSFAVAQKRTQQMMQQMLVQQLQRAA